MADRTISTFSDAVIATGRGGVQTVIGGTQSGGDLILQDNPTAQGGFIQLGNGIWIDRTGPTPRISILAAVALGNALSIPFDTAIRGAGTGTLVVNNDVLGIVAGGGGGGGFLQRNTSALQAVLLATTIGDFLTLGAYDVNNSPIAALLVNVPASPPNNYHALLVVDANRAGAAMFAIGRDGRIGINRDVPATPSVQIDGWPLVFRSQSGAILDIPDAGAQTLAATEAKYLPVAVAGGATLYAKLYALAAGGGGVGDSFARADTTAGLGTSSSGQVWTAQSGTFGIQSNHAYVVTHNPLFDITTLGGQAANGTIIATMSAIADSAGIMWRGAGNLAQPGTFYTVHDFAAAGRYDVLYWTGSQWQTPNVWPQGGWTPAAQDQFRVTLASSSPKMKVEVKTAVGSLWTTIYTADATDDGASGFTSHNPTSVLHGLKSEGVSAARWADYNFTP